MTGLALTPVLPENAPVRVLSAEAVRKLGERFRMAARSENFLDFSRSARR
jgi:hypothetical protein